MYNQDPDLKIQLSYSLKTKDEFGEGKAMAESLILMPTVKKFGLKLHRGNCADKAQREPQRLRLPRSTFGYYRT